MESFKLITFSSLVLFIIIFMNAPSEVLANNELYRGMLKGEEIKLATYQVSFVKQLVLKISFF